MAASSMPGAIPDEADPQVADATRRGLTEARRDAVRKRALAEIPWWYRPHGHLAGTTGIGLAVLVVSGLALARTALRWTDLLVIPAVILLANYFEWRVHRDVLHKRRWPLEVIYDKHTPMHHMIYVEEDMALREASQRVPPRPHSRRSACPRHRPRLRRPIAVRPRVSFWSAGGRLALLCSPRVSSW